jgi:hypothetical protein
MSMRSLVLVALVALVAGCTSGGSPLAPEERTTTVAENFAPVPEGMSRLVFLRAGRERQFVAFGCSRSAGILCRAMVATRERPLSLSLTFSAA